MSGHTPGPWETNFDTIGGKACGNYIVANGSLVAAAVNMPGYSATENWLANARLIAAAPDMDAALLPLALSDENNPPPGVDPEDRRGAVQNARAARAKARGQS